MRATPTIDGSGVLSGWFGVRELAPAFEELALTPHIDFATKVAMAVRGQPQSGGKPPHSETLFCVEIDAGDCAGDYVFLNLDQVRVRIGHSQ
jgi:hypothetical protein